MATLATPPGQLKELRKAVGRHNVLSEPGQLLSFESDALTSHRATPSAVVFVKNGAELRQVVSTLHKARIPFVPRGAGTGLSGGAIADGAVIIEMSRMNRILWIDAENRRARVQPGVVNAQLANAVAPFGLMYAPDPSSQTACTLGGNVAENSGGPHCLKYGVTTNHILALRVVTPQGAEIELPGREISGYDLVGLFVGSEGTLGICSEIEVNLVARPAAVETLLAHFERIADASRAVSAIIAAGILPAALEMIDQNTLKAVEASVFAAGFPTDIAASLIVELDGPSAGLPEQAAAVEKLLRKHKAREVARAASEEERLRFWKARKSAFGALGRIGSDLLVQDATVPRSRIPDVLGRVFEIAEKYDLVITNVFHAGDGNLHPNIPFDRRDTEVTERVHAASREIMEACVAAGGTITGEHGVGVDKMKYMTLIYSDDDLETMRWVKQVFDPKGLCNPGKLLPDSGERPEESHEPDPPAPPAPPSAAMSARDVTATIESALGSECLLDDPESFVIDEVASEVVAAPLSLEQLAELMKLASVHRWAVVPAGQGGGLANGIPHKRVDLVVSTRRLDAPPQHQPEDLLASVAAGVPLERLNSALAEAAQWWPLDPLGGGTVGALIASDSSGPLAMRYGSPRDLVLGLTVVLADGRIVKAGGRVVKNVAGYDMVRLYVGSYGTLGVIAEAHLRLHALPPADVTRVFRARNTASALRVASAASSGDTLPPAATEVFSPGVATALGLADDAWQVAVRWLGHESDVEDAVRAATRLPEADVAKVRATERIWTRVGELANRMEASLTLRLDSPIRATADLIKRATPFVGGGGGGGGGTSDLMVSPHRGRIRIFVNEATYEAVGERVWALRIEELRRAARATGGGLRVEQAPVELRRIVDPWGEPGPEGALHSAIKGRFDPRGVLKPGFFVRGL